MDYCFYTDDLINYPRVYKQCFLIDVIYAINQRNAEDMTITYCVMNVLKS